MRQQYEFTVLRKEESISWQPDCFTRREAPLNREASCGLADGGERDLVARISRTGESRRCGGVRDGDVHCSNIII